MSACFRALDKLDQIEWHGGIPTGWWDDDDWPRNDTDECDVPVYSLIFRY